MGQRIRKAHRKRFNFKCNFYSIIANPKSSMQRDKRVHQIFLIANVFDIRVAFLDINFLTRILLNAPFVIL